MIQIKSFRGETRQYEDTGTFYFIPVESVVMEYLANNNIEYVDLQFVYDGEEVVAYLIYKTISI